MDVTTGIAMDVATDVAVDVATGAPRQGPALSDPSR